MQCPACKVPVAAGATQCARCRLVVRRRGDRLEPVYPPIRRGVALYSVDLRRERPLGVPAGAQRLRENTVETTTTPEGLAVQLAPGAAYRWTCSAMSLRDVCVRVKVTLHDPAGLAFVLARSEAVGAARTQYAFIVSAARRAGQLARMTSSADESVFTSLTEWAEHPAVAPCGAPMEVELRVQGPMLEGLVDGQRVAAVHDPVLGFGGIGLRLECAAPDGAKPAPDGARALWSAFEACEVGA